MYSNKDPVWPKINKVDLLLKIKERKNWGGGLEGTNHWM